MIIKNHKEIYKNVAEKLELPYDIIELIGNFTWSELGKSLENFEHRQTYIYKLGSFRFRKRRVGFELSYFGRLYGESIF